MYPYSRRKKTGYDPLDCNEMTVGMDEELEQLRQRDPALVRDGEGLWAGKCK